MPTIKANWDGNIAMPRLPGYIPNSEWFFTDILTFLNAYAAGTNVAVKAAGGTRIKNVITDVTATIVNGGAAGHFQFFIIDGAAPLTGTNPRWFADTNGAGFMTNLYTHYDTSDPLQFSLNSQIRLVGQTAGILLLSAQFAVKGYQIQA
jgi:hypothetical protein